MAINFPGSLDNFTNPTSASPINSPSHADQHANANDAIEALEAKVGANNSTITTSHDYKIAQLESLVTSSVAGAKSIYQDVRNQSGSEFVKGTPVYVSGSEGASGKMLISAASNASEATSSKTMGITTSAISNNSNGQVISEGILEGIDTTGAADGDPVWLGVNGAKIYGLVNKPSAPAHLVFLGIVIRGGQANTGSMYVKIQNGFELQEIHNVELSSLVNGNVLAYDSSTSTWKNTNTLQSTSSTVPLVIKRVTSQTSNLQEWRDQSGGMLAFFNKDGALTFNSSSAIGGTLNVFTSYAGNTGVIIRGFTSQTADLQQWQNSSGTVNARIDAYGTFQNGTAGGYGAWINVQPAQASDKGIIIRGAASQTANLQEWQDSAGTVLANIWASGTFATAGRIAVGNGSTGAKLDIMPASTTQVGVTIKANASQTANLQEWQSDTGTVLSKVTSSGRMDVSGLTVIGNAYSSGVVLALFVGTGTSQVPLASRGSSTQTANLQEWQNSSGTVLTSVSNLGHLQTPRLVIVNGGNIVDSAGTTPYFGFGSNQIAIYTRNAAYKGLVIQGSASQTADLQQWQTSAGQTNLSVNFGGALQSYIQMTADNTNSGITSFIAKTAYANVKPMIVQGAASQTAPLQEWQNSAGTVLAKVDASGQITSTGNDHYFSSSTAYRPNIHITNTTADSNGSYILFEKSRAGTAVVSGDVLGVLNFTGFDTSTYVGSAIVYGVAEGTFSTTSRPGKIVFATVSNGTTSMVDRMTIANSGTVTINGFNAASQGLIIKGAASQTANLQEWQNSDGTVLARIYPTGFINTASGIGAGTTSYMNGIDDLTATKMSLRFNSTSYGLQLTNIQAGAVGYIVKGAASQTANLQEWQNSAGTVNAFVTVGGFLGTNSDVRGLTGGIFGGITKLSSAGLTVYTTAAGNPGAIIRGAASQSANLQEWQNSAGTLLASISSAGSAWFKIGARVSGNYGGSQALLVQNDQNIIGLTIKANTTQTANLTEWQDSAGTVLVKVAADGRVTFPGANADVHASGNLTVRGSDAWSANASALIGTGYAGGIGLIVKAVASQTANLQEWQDSSGTVQAYIGANGFINTNNSLRVAGDNISAYRFQGVSDGNYTMNFPGSGNIQLFSATNDTGSGVGVLGIKNATTAPTSNPTTGGILYVSSGALLYRGTSNESQQIIGSDGSVKFTSPAASIVPLIIQHTSSPTSSYFEVRNSAGNPVWGINSTGEALTRTTTKFGANIQNDSNNNNTALTLSAPSTSGSGIALNVYSGSTTRDMARFDNSGVVKLRITSDGSFKGGNSSTISANTATTVDTVALSSFTTIEYTISIKQGSKIRSSKVLVHTDGTSVDSTEYGIMEMGGGITGILVLASVSSTDSILQITIADATTTNATVKLIKTML